MSDSNLEELTKAQLLARVSASRDHFEKALASVSDDAMESTRLEGDWSPKDMLAHIGVWERRVEHVFSRLLAGEEPDALLGEGGIDEYNARFYAEWQHSSLDEVRNFEREMYSRFLGVIERASEADLFDPQRFPWMEGEPYVGLVFGNTIDHYEEHLGELQSALKDEATRSA